MKKKLFLQTTALMLAILFLFSACASTTIINSIPGGARLYIDGEPVGERLVFPIVNGVHGDAPSSS